MTALDQAFIKAFSQQNAATTTKPAPSADTADHAQALPLGARASQAGTSPRQTPLRGPATPSTASLLVRPKTDTLRNVLAAFENQDIERGTRDEGRAARDETQDDATTWNKQHEQGVDLLHEIAAVQTAAKTATTRRTVERPTTSTVSNPSENTIAPRATTESTLAAVAAKTESTPWPVGLDCSVAETTVWTCDNSPWAVAGGQWSNASGQWPVVSGQRNVSEELSEENSSQQAGLQQMATVESPILPISKSPNPSSVAPLEFKPAWQVDRFTWPRVCRRLIGRASDELDRLADALMAANARGKQVLAVAGCRRGEGATTLLLCAARRLAERGINAVLVDADQNRPRLAKRLGVQPQHGWNEAGSDGVSLDQTIVAAAGSNLALAPLCDPSDGNANGDGNSETNLSECLATLRQHYEMVLVDTGPLEEFFTNDARGGSATTPGEAIDALLLVRNDRITPDDDMNEIERDLDAAEIAVMGLIENFADA